MVWTSRRTVNSPDCKSGGRTVGGTEPGSGGYGLYGGKGWSTCARASVNPARGTLRTPSTVAKAVVTSSEVCRRISVPPRLDPGNVLISSHRFRRPGQGKSKILVKLLG